VLAEQVETLTKASFDKRVQSDIILVKFYAPWCGHCKAMAPAYEEAAKRLANHAPPVPLGKVDATQEPDIAQNHGIRGYPTLKIFRRGVASDYGGPRDADGIVKHMLDQVGSSTPANSLSKGQDLPPQTDDSPLLMARLCRDQTCEDEKFPILDYAEDENKCICSAHPCWDDGGKHHSCDGTEFPHLKYEYSKDGKLECGCSSEPHYASTYIAKVKCPGEHCDSPQHPLLDWDPKDARCVCRSHPCHDLDGARHECSDINFPILHYREENKPEGGVKKICECKGIRSKANPEEL
jgi:protein disulfide-isomerase-like protein